MIFVIGATGFVGKKLACQLKNENIQYIKGTRNLYGDISSQENWPQFFVDIDCVVHLAARVHVMNDTELDPIIKFRAINVTTTLKIAIAAKEMKVRRFIFISSIKVNGEETNANPFKACDPTNPRDPYGQSKLEAEIELMKLHEKGVFEVVIIRPPLIYGKGVKANFEKLMWLVKKDLPIPFGLVKNKRSLVSVLNLCDLIIHCISHPSAGGEIFLVSDDRDYSLREMIIEMGKVLKKTPHLLPVPVGLMKFTATCLGKKAYANRLFGNLHVDITKTKDLLNWKPKYSFLDTFK